MAVPYAHGREITVKEKLTMFQLADMRDALELVVAEQGGELTPEQEQLWDSIGQAFEAKVENTALLIRERECHAEAIRLEVKRLVEMAVSLESDADRLKKLLLNRMQVMDRQEVKGRLVRVALQKNAPAVVPLRELTEADLRALAVAAPYAVRVQPETFSLAKDAIKEQYKTTGALPPAVASVVEIKQGVRLAIK